MRIAILADVHANLPAFHAVLADAEDQGCQRVYHAGDLIAIGPYPAKVVDLARARAVKCVQGNHEQLVWRGIPLEPGPSMDDEELMHQHWTHSRLDKPRRDFLRALPHVLEETVEGVRLLVVHFALEDDGRSFKGVGSGATDDEILGSFGQVRADLVCFGHLHNRRLNRAQGGVHFLNPGATGCSRDALADYAVIDLLHGTFHIALRRVPYDRQALLARYDELEIPARQFIREILFGVAAAPTPNLGSR